LFQRPDIRVALIGFGYAGRVFHAPLISSTPGLNLVVIGSRRQENARSAYPNTATVSDALAAIRREGVDLVVIATPNDTHAPLAEAALHAGKHVVVDKPFTVTLAEARTLAATATEVGRTLSVFQNRRWDSDFLGVAREIAAGRVGEVVEMRSEIGRYRPQVRDRWRERAGPGAGLWYDLGPHLIDQALVLFGVPESVHADLRIQRAGGSTIDWFEAALDYGRRRVLLSSSMLAADSPNRFLVRGTRGSLIKRKGDPQEDQLLSDMKPGSPEWGRDPDPVIFTPGDGSAPLELETPAGNYLDYFAAIRDAIRGEGRVPVTSAQATTLMAIIEAGIRSSTEGHVVSPECAETERSAWGTLVTSSYLGSLSNPGDEP
jgi:predicted dehydrogenase